MRLKPGHYCPRWRGLIQDRSVNLQGLALAPVAGLPRSQHRDPIRFRSTCAEAGRSPGRVLRCFIKQRDSTAEGVVGLTIPVDLAGWGAEQAGGSLDWSEFGSEDAVLLDPRRW